MTPLISVVIPTAGRPQYLPRAVDSALSGMDAGDIEVIVVPNGSDNSWQETLLPCRDNPSVRIIPVREANANTARNTGLAEARGEYIRFLDDDDFLYPGQAVKQYELIRSSGADVVSGSVEVIDEVGSCLRIWQQPDTDDLCAAVLGPLRNCLPTAHVYRRLSLGSARWNPSTRVRQDVEWLMDLCASREMRWEKTKDVVGIWQQHADQRISSGINMNEICRVTVPMILKAYDRLAAEDRLNESRRKSASMALWGLTAKAFMFEPLYWTQVARKAIGIHPTARHPYIEYNIPVIGRLNPLLMQWALLPKRWIGYQMRRIINRRSITRGR